MDQLEFGLQRYVVQGEGKGPSVVITGGVHGDEQTGTYAAMLVWEKLRSLEVLGSVAILPLCNVSAGRARKRGAAEDGLDLNRTFPGDAAGGYTERLAAYLWQLTAGYDYLLDLHCCGLYGSTYGMGWYSRHPWAKDLLRALCLDTVVHTKGTRGQLYIESAERRGQKAVLIELPGGQPGGVIDAPEAEKCAEGIINYLRCIGAVAGQARPWTATRFCGTFGESCDAPCDGLFRPIAAAGSFVAAGQAVGELNGQPVAAPCAGVATMVSPLRYAFKGSTLASVAPDREVAPGEINPQD